MLYNCPVGLGPFCFPGLIGDLPFKSHCCQHIQMFVKEADVGSPCRCWANWQQGPSLPGLFLPHIPQFCPDSSQGNAQWCVFPAKHGKQGWNSKYVAGWLLETVTEISLRVGREKQVFLACDSFCLKVHFYISSHESYLLSSTNSEEL